MSRKIALLLFVCLGAAFAPGAQAQSFAGMICQANAGTPPDVRFEGDTELVGDFVMACTGGTPTPMDGSVPTVTLTVDLNLSITSRVLDQGLAFNELCSSWTNRILLLIRPHLCWITVT